MSNFPRIPTVGPPVVMFFSFFFGRSPFNAQTAIRLIRDDTSPSSTLLYVHRNHGDYNRDGEHRTAFVVQQQRVPGEIKRS